MTTALVGALAGLLVGGISFGFSRALAGRVDLPETRLALNVSGWIQVILFPIAGYFIAPLVFGE